MAVDRMGGHEAVGDLTMPAVGRRPDTPHVPVRSAIGGAAVVLAVAFEVVAEPIDVAHEGERCKCRHTFRTVWGFPRR